MRVSKMLLVLGIVLVLGAVGTCLGPELTWPEKDTRVLRELSFYIGAAGFAVFVVGAFAVVLQRR
ncbi:MAG: hypothetical protein ACE5I3_02880 [Phycisphaerae bacterium]